MTRSRRRALASPADRGPFLATEPVADRALCGWRVRSVIDLPELPVWTQGDRRPDVTIALGRVTPVGDAAPGMNWNAAGDGGFRFTVAAVGSYRISQGRVITIDPQVGAMASAVRQYLLGTAFGVLCHQRGLLPLHASCVAINGRAVAIAGASGAGKSSLAAALVRLGYPLLGDDVCVIDASEINAPRVLPAIPRLKLWRDVLDAFGLAVDPAARILEGIEKYQAQALPDRPAVPPPLTPLPLGVVYYLDQAGSRDNQGFHPIRGAERAAALAGAVYRRKMGLALGLLPQIFTATMTVGALVPGHRLLRHGDLSGLDALARSVVARQEGRG
ncbi:serine kinase [Rhodospirillum rubrum]|uniref:serine kinase n=1 Tax=Rhodospirillum rubrum TaxID=1085 RepID=UPI001907C235|nr:serine kinase [Rhodospirillum rubrum]MBK1663186.1 serine kinase [Rhodospirillum rubrum]MBK1676989.1 serine kinase [Rhodospirillum rubrum]